MLVEVKVPQLSESVSEATLVSWHKKEGDFVARDENLIDIETDKVVLETPAPEAGVIQSIRKPNGSLVTSNELIAVIDTDAKKPAGAAALAAQPANDVARPAVGIEAKTLPAPTEATVASAQQAPVSRSAAAGALPAARKMMAEQGVDPSSIDGTGRGGRRVDAVCHADQPHTPMHEAAPRLLGFYAVTGEAREVIHQQHVEVLGLRLRQHPLVARAVGDSAADRFIVIPGRDRPALAGGPLLAIPELVGDGTLFLVLG